MFMFRLNSDRVVNLSYLILAERIDHDSGKVRVTIDTGISFDLDRSDGERLMDQLHALADDPYPGPTTTVIRRDSSIPPEGRTG